MPMDWNTSLGLRKVMGYIWIFRSDRDVGLEGDGY